MMGFSASLLKQVFEPYKEELKLNLVAWSTLITSILGYYYFLKQIDPLTKWLIFIPFFTFIYTYIQIVILDKKLNLKHALSTIYALTFISALYWVHVWYAAAPGFFLISTILLTILIMYRRREFLGRSMALVEEEVFGEPLTKKWRDKLAKERKKK